MNSNDTIIYLKNLLLYYLDELKHVSNHKNAQFAYGEKTAYTECLEVLKLWEESAQHGLDFDIEKRYPL